ncbi:NodT family efflux transporter outer membrane factor (OMF) lipoprotein [Nitrospirillum amazonense]|uniref:NodT family efflux transporter outer membrane factor (OMF) lipoprotein n=1 Tax=Nitrospirillum amazonense TaxID=28077 RepID=A0A560EQD5_9PROT|nr:efflux transporter outer membrane subunit [Nitrospirillum amazonense]TWB11590.1 NodT family efflux transporter outer membrane factor (OMF) lipoprotein [Nitrospirillum amazonense]
MSAPASFPSRPLRRLGASLCLSAALLGLSACAWVPDVGSAPAPRDAAGFASQASFAPSSPATVAWPQDRWWVAYGDAQLDALIEEGLAGAPDLAAAAARLRKAEALADQADAALLPRVTANAQVTEDKQSYRYLFPPAFVPKGYHEVPRATLDLSYDFDFWGKNRASLAAATSDAEAARAEVAQARLTLSAGIAAAYADLAQQVADRAAAAEAVDVRVRSTNLVRQRRENGLETLGAVRQAEAREAAARGDLAAQDEAIALTRNRLAALMGAGPDRGLSIQPPAGASLKAFGLPANLAADLLGRRPDVVAARLTVEAAAKRIAVAKAAFYPNVNLAAYFGVQTLGLNALTKSGATIGSVGPAVSLPLFEGGALAAQYRGARADYDAAVADYDGTVAKALQDVADAAASARALETRLTHARDALAAATDAHRIATARYEGKLSTYLDVLTAEDTLITDRRALADLQARAFTLDIALIRALGGGYQAASAAPQAVAAR